jgi:hypothetical protein
MKSLKKEFRNFEPLIHRVIEQEAATQGIKISRGIELVLVTIQETIVLPKAKLIVVEHVHVVIKVRYNEPRFNQHNGSIVRGVPREWNRGIHRVDKVPRPNFPRCTYCHQIGHQIMNVHLLKIM